MVDKIQRAKLNEGWQRATSELADVRWDNAALAEEKAAEASAVSDEGSEVGIANELKDVGAEADTAATIYPKRPRAHAVGYNPNSRTLYVVFRDNTWYEYRNVPADMWMALKGAESTGKFLKESGLDNWEDKGSAMLDGMSEAFKARLASASASASRLQKGDLKNWSAKDYFKNL